MRINENKASFLKEVVLSIDPKARLYLFGSRTDDNKRGGDLDILIISSRKLNLSERAGIKFSYMRKFGEQKMDLINYTDQERSIFKDLIIDTAIEL